jgi:MFS family permease
LPKRTFPGLEKKLFPVGTILFWTSLYVYVPILPPYTEFLSRSLTIVGLVVGSYGFTQLLFRFPVGIWSDKKGRRKPFVLSGFAFAFVSCIGLALSPNAWLLLLFRGLAGVAASMWVAFTVLYSSYFRDAQTARAMSLITFCVGFAQMAGTYSGGKIADAYGWLAPFYVGAVLSALGAGFMLPISEKVNENRFIFSRRSLLSIASRRRLLSVSIITALSQFAVFITTYGFLPIYATRIGASKGDLGVLMFILHLCQTLSMLLAGTVVAPRIGYKAAVGAAYAVITCATVVTPYIRDLHLLLLIQGLGALGRGLAYPVLMGLAIQGVPQEEKAAAMGFFQAVYAIGMFSGPAAGGVIGDTFGLRGVFFCAGFVYLIATVLSASTLPKRAAD